MNTFYIVRHGETENNRNGRLSGQIDTPLTPDGIASTSRAVEKLRDIPVTAVYSSDLGRAFITACAIVRELHIPHEIVRESGLREVSYGDASNMLRNEAYVKYPGLDSDTHYTPPNGESLAHMQARVLGTLQNIDGQYTDSNILIVAHSGVMAALNASFTGGDFGHHNMMDEYPHDCVVTFTMLAGKVTSFKLAA